jgi:hypothetical protein
MSCRDSKVFVIMEIRTYGVPVAPKRSVLTREGG